MSKNILGLFLILIGIASSCDMRKNRSGELQEIKKMSARLDSTYALVPSINVQEIQNSISIIKKDLKYAQDSAKRSVTLEEGIVFDNYKDIYKLFKSYPVGNLPAEYSKHKKQLKEFSKLITSEATLDKNGKEITDTYIDQNFQAEMRYCTDFVNKIIEVEKRAVTFRTRYKEDKPVVDSLILEITKVQ